MFKQHGLAGMNQQKPPIVSRSSHGAAYHKVSNANQTQAHKVNRNGIVSTGSQPQGFSDLGRTGASKNDAEVMVEKALIELTEVRNDILIQKNGEDRAEKIHRSDSKSQL